MSASRAAPAVGSLVAATSAAVVLVESDAAGAVDGAAWLLAAGTACSLVLIALGTITEPTRVAGPRLVLGATWLTPLLVSVVALPTWLRTVTDAYAAAIGGLVAYAVVGDAARTSPPLRAASRAVVVAGITTFLSRLVLVDPFADPACPRLCDHNPLYLGTPSSWGATVSAVGRFGLLAAIAWTGAVAFREAPAPGPRRPAAARAALGLVGAALVVVGGPGSVGLLSGDPTRGFALLVADVAVTGWALWGLSVPARQWWLAVRLSRLAARLESGGPPGALQRILREAVGDPDLALTYAAPTGGYVDERGAHAAEPSPAGYRVTLVERGGRPLAQIHHSPSVDGRRLERAMGPPVRLALQNAQLRAASLAELAELTASRARVVERAELERRRLERNLHDGAQQRAVSIALLVRMLVQRPDVDAEGAAAVRTMALARVLSEELRQVARGIHPAVLADSGLAGAALELAERSTDVAVVVGDLPARRFPPAVESTAYLVVDAARSDAAARGATEVVVAGAVEEGLVVEVTDNGRPSPESPRVNGLLDRVQALGGLLDVESDGLGVRVRTVLPCAP